MSTSRLTRGAAKVLAKEDIGRTSASPDQRERAVGAIREALVARAKQRSRRRWLFPLAVAAGVAALVGAGGWAAKHAASTTTAALSAREDVIAAESVRGAAFVRRAGEQVVLQPLATIVSGEPISTSDGEAEMAFHSGAKVQIAPATEVTMSAGQRTELVRLDRGTVTSHVTKRHDGERFVVHTAEADVEVRGTIFRVSRTRDGACGERTRVHVDEGRVDVHAASGTTTLEPGSEWVSTCIVPDEGAVPHASTTPAEVAPRASASTLSTSQPVPAHSTVAAVAARPTATHPEVPMTSDLTRQNALFADAMKAKGNGESRRAISILDTLLDEHPRTPLREAAEAQRMNLLAGIASSSGDKTRAASLAKEYLARYPRGFARGDAERIVHGAP